MSSILSVKSSKQANFSSFIAIAIGAANIDIIFRLKQVFSPLFHFETFITAEYESVVFLSFDYIVVQLSKLYGARGVCTYKSQSSRLCTPVSFFAILDYFIEFLMQLEALFCTSKSQNNY